MLQSAEVQYAPQEQKIAFLKAKNLTTEEIDLAFQRASATPSHPQYDDPRYAPRPPYNYQYPPSPYPYTQPPPLPELPRRDWRDWFIMATVIGGVGYAATTLAKRYIVPLIAPPTPPQLEQDKSSIDAAFDKTFALLDQVVSDTEKLKQSEADRTERLDTALKEVEAVLAELKASAAARQDDDNNLNKTVQDLQKMVPKAIQTHADSADAKLRDLAGEVKSLKTLLSNKVGAAAGVPRPGSNGAGNGVANGTSAPGASSDSQTQIQASTQSNGVTPKPSIDNFRASETDSSAGSPYARLMNGRAAIPAWQMAAAGSPGPAANGKDGSGSGGEVKSQGIATSG